MPRAPLGQPRKAGKGKKGKGRPPRQQVAQDLHENESENDPNDDFIDQNATGLNNYQDQEQLTEEQKEELITKTLSTTNPQAAHNITEYSYKDRQYRKDELVDQLVVHFSFDGDIIQNESEEKREQDEYWEEKALMDKQMIEQGNQGIVDEHGKAIEQDEKILKRSLRNQFNFSERSAQTFNNPVRERGIKTEPPPTSNFASSANQWKIYEEYMKEFEMIQKKEQDQERERLKGGKEKNDKKKAAVKEDPLFSNSMKRSLRLMERMIVQNTEEVKFHDYRYFQEVAEEGTDAKVGSVLPLWRFSTEKSRKKNVTSICWNPRYKDMFAVGYGSYDFLKQSTGLICCFTIKNPTWPEYSFTTESGVMCLDFHPEHPALLSVGCYDGTVMVFDIRSKSNKPIYMSTVRTNKHTDPVWQVSWHHENDPTKQLNLFSISSDGRVMNWSLMKNKLEPEQALKLKLVVDQDKELEVNKEAFLYGLAGGMCFDFSKFDKNKYLVGTEEGKIHLCSKAYSGQYIETYEGHYLAVYAVKWNKYHDRVFLSCSADWTVKMWDCTIKKPIMTFDLGCAVGDIEWAPYSSTVFATVTSSGMLYIYDLKQGKHTYLCEHQTLKKAKGLHVSFNPVDPIILVGDERGGVNSFKLSGNLVIGPMQPPKVEDDAKDHKGAGKTPAQQEEPKEPKITSEKLEADKMEEILSKQDKDLY